MNSYVTAKNPYDIRKSIRLSVYAMQLIYKQLSSY